MARKQVELTIDAKKITVKELIVKDMIEIKKTIVGMTSFDDFMANIDTILPYATSLTYAELIELAPSDIKVIYDKFKEVNAIFFEMAQAMGLGEVLTGLKTQLIYNLKEQSFRSQPQVSRKS